MGRKKGRKGGGGRGREKEREGERSEQFGEELCIVRRVETIASRRARLRMHGQLHNLKGPVKNEIVGSLVQ